MTIPESDWRKLLGAASGDSALLYLYLRAGGDLEHGETALRFSRSRMECAAASLKQMGLWPDAPKPLRPAEPPTYTEADLIQEMKKPGGFNQLLGEAQRRLGKVLSTEELKVLLSLYDYLGLFWLPVRRPAPVETVVLPTAREPRRLPNLSHFLVRRLKPKPGGGFSEEHELRDYRPGDSMREIHWKLSVKTDRTIVREAQEPVRGLTLLTFDLRGTPDRVDATLEELLWLSQWLLRHDTPHQILWIDPTDCQMATASMEREEDLQPLLGRLLRAPLRDDTPSIEGRSFPRATWRCHVSPQEDAP